MPLKSSRDFTPLSLLATTCRYSGYRRPMTRTLSSLLRKGARPLKAESATSFCTMAKSTSPAWTRRMFSPEAPVAWAVTEMAPLLLLVITWAMAPPRGKYTPEVPPVARVRRLVSAWASEAASSRPAARTRLRTFFIRLSREEVIERIAQKTASSLPSLSIYQMRKKGKSGALHLPDGRAI